MDRRSNRKDTTKSKSSSIVIAGIMERVNCSSDKWVVKVCPTTGGEFELSIPSHMTVEGLKYIIGKRLKLSMDKINLLYKDRILKTGSLIRHGVMDGCKFTLLPNVETGLSTQKTDNSIMQVLKNLSEKQVNEFLAGKSPLTLAMKLGDHMMFLQLQLSSSPYAVQGLPIKRPATNFQPNHHNQPQPSNHQIYSHHHQQHINHQIQHTGYNCTHPQFHPAKSCTVTNQRSVTRATKSCPYSKSSINESNKTELNQITQPCVTETMKVVDASSDLKPTALMSSTSSVSSSRVLPETTERLLSNISQKTSDFSDPSICSHDSSVSSSLPASLAIPRTSTNLNQEHSVLSDDNNRRFQPQCSNVSPNFSPSASPMSNTTLQQKICELQKMSKENRSKEEPRCLGAQPAAANCTKEGTKCPGAVINCMHHVGKGVYSGTFSGTLNPALHDGEGKPKKNLNTIVHILKDLLGTAPRARVQQLANSRRRASRRRDQVFAGSEKSQDDTEKLQKETEMLKHKVEKVQMMLENRRQRRRAKREARASPYGWSKPTVVSTDTESSEKNHVEVNMETGLPGVNQGDENSSFSSKLKPEAVLV